MKSIILSLFVFVSSFFFSFNNCLADDIGDELSNDLSVESKVNDNRDDGDIPKASNEDIFGDEQAFPFIAGLGKNAAH